MTKKKFFTGAGVLSALLSPPLLVLMKEEIRLMSHFYYCIVVLIFLKKIQIIRFALNLTSLIGLWKNMWD